MQYLTYKVSITNAVLQNLPLNRDNFLMKNICIFLDLFYAILCDQKILVSIFREKKTKSIMLTVVDTPLYMMMFIISKLFLECKMGSHEMQQFRHLSIAILDFSLLLPI